jgi:predicted Rossmann fold nucleotide-binding protein DprA/Smf involved in DNA uptake
LFILENKKKFKKEEILKKIKEREVKIITIFDKNYPELLKNIPNSPFLFYLR